jgi:lysophospholipase L1-like esterase
MKIQLYFAYLIMNKRFISILALLLAVNLCFAQDTKKTPRFWDDVQTIKKFDELYKPQAHPILFVGSSSIRKWSSLNVAFGPYNVLNRGIGGAVVNDITFYLNDIIFPYSPRQIVIYVGGNDFVDINATADSVFNRTVNLYQAIRAKLPAVPIAYISIQSAPSREAHTERIIALNQMMKDFMARQANASFIDVFSQLRKDGKNRPELFVKDMLHLNSEGYAIWEKTIGPYLVKR